MKNKIPTHEELSSEKLTCVSNRILDDWRHGVVRSAVFYRASDGTYWKVIYRVSTDGETNELADGTAGIFKVRPVSVVVTEYVTEL